MKKLFFSCIFFVLIASLSFAHEADIKDDELEHVQIIKNSAIYVVIASAALIGIFILISLYIPKKKNRTKVLLFIGIALPAIFSTVYISGATVYENLVSESKGPVHWHADFEVWNCGKKIDLIDPKGLLNRIGTPEFHEHGDDRIHLEGTVLRKSYVDLHNFFQVVGGNLNNDYLFLPTDDGFLELGTGMECNGQEAQLQVFAYKITNPDAFANSGFYYTQEKVEDFSNYIISPYINVPPGDCIIVELDVPKEKTEHICSSYTLAEELGRMQKG